jgi:hypothetical protein
VYILLRTSLILSNTLSDLSHRPASAYTLTRAEYAVTSGDTPIGSVYIYIHTHTHKQTGCVLTRVFTDAHVMCMLCAVHVYLQL